MNKKIIITTVIIAVIILAGVGYWKLSGMFVSTVGKYDNFAKCLTEKGVEFYGASWCPHCQNQKKMFGDSFKYVNSIECTEKQQLCTDKGITGFPTWIIDGKLNPGEKTMEQLSALTGCKVN